MTSSSSVQTVVIEVYINKELLRNSSFDEDCDSFEIIEIRKQNTNKATKYLRELQKLIPTTFHKSFGDQFKQYPWYIENYGEYPSLINTEQDMSLAIDGLYSNSNTHGNTNSNNKNINTNNNSYADDDITAILKLRLIFAENSLTIVNAVVDADPDGDSKLNESNYVEIPGEGGVNYEPIIFCNTTPYDWHNRRSKTIVLLGETGQGKTATINSMMNYLYKADMHHSLRYKLIDESGNKSAKHCSHTNEVNQYFIQPPKLDYNLLVIDTPGLGDSRGAKCVERNSCNIKNLFAIDINSCDMIFFVINATATILTERQQMILNEFTSIFGADITDNFYILCTFAGDAKPNAMDVLKGFYGNKIPYNKTYYKMDNEVFGEYAPDLESKSDTDDDSDSESDSDNESDDDNFERKRIKDVRISLWKRNMKQFKKIFKKLKSVEPVSLQMTKQVLKERKMLQGYIEGIHPQMNLLLKQIVADKENMMNISDIAISWMELRYVPEKVPADKLSMICDKCQINCCVGCTSWIRVDCRASSWTFRCNVCPGHCSMFSHSASKHKYIYNKEYVEIIGDELLLMQQLAKNHANEKKNCFDELSRSEKIINQLLR